MSDYKIFFCSSKKIAKYASEIPNPKIGCTTAGEIDNALTKGLSSVEFSEKYFNIEAVKVENVSIPVLKTKEIQAAAKKVSANKKNLLCFVMNDGLAGCEEIMQATLSAILPKGTPIFGGSTGDDLDFKDTYCCIDNEVFKGSVIILIGTDLNYYIHKENIFEPTDKSIIVTEAKGRTVYTLDNVKASKIYASLLGVSENSIDKHFFENPFGKVNGDEIYISSPQKVNPDGSITFYCNMLPSSFLKLLKVTDIQAQFEKTSKAILSKGTPLFTLTSNCILRKLKFENDKSENLINSYLRKIKAVGWTTYGEQLNNLHINQTMVTLTFYER